jgi:anti-sigma28 factor (negative regulator of flagellin synthesis)
MKAGIMDVDTIEAITRELENGNYKVLDKKSFSMIVETVKNVLIENIKSTIPDELMSNPVFKRGFDGEK